MPNHVSPPPSPVQPGADGQIVPKYSLSYHTEKGEKEGDIRIQVYVGVEDLSNKNRSSLIRVHRSTESIEYSQYYYVLYYN